MTQTQCTLVDLSNFCLKVSVARRSFILMKCFLTHLDVSQIIPKVNFIRTKRSEVEKMGYKNISNCTCIG